MTLQQRENTIYGKVWYGTSYSSSSTQYGPLVVLPALESATSSWSNVENQTYTMGTTNFNGTNAYTIASYNGSINYNYTWEYDKAAAHGARAVVVISKY